MHQPSENELGQLEQELTQHIYYMVIFIILRNVVVYSLIGMKIL